MIIIRETTYADAGVHVNLGNKASKVLYEAAKLTWQNRKGMLGEVVEVFEDYSGLRAIHVGGLPKGTFINLNLDGNGTKIEIGERAKKHDTAALDLIAMVCDDGVVRGGEPVIVGSILDVRSLKEKSGKTYIGFVKQLGIGYIKAAEEAEVAIVNGEIAEIGARVSGYGEFNYNWGAAVVWFGHKSRLITGYKIRKGDSLVALREDGFRANGISLLRETLKNSHGNGWHKKSYNGKNLAELALHPSRIYTRAVVDMFGGYNLDRKPKAKIHGVAHITGGGIPEKLGRTLRPSKLGATIDNLFEPCDLMLYCQEKGNVTDRHAYKTWNMGQGMIIITPEPDKVMEVADQYSIESKVVGSITSERIIKIKSRGFHSEGKRLEFRI